MISRKPIELPKDTPVVETPITSSLKTICESGALDTMRCLSTEIGGSDIELGWIDDKTDKQGIGVFAAFAFAKRKYTPQLIDREPWQVWYRCEAVATADSNFVDLALVKDSSEDENRQNKYRTARWANGAWQGLDEVVVSARKICDAVHPKTGIDGSLYDSFNGDLLAAIEISGGNRLEYSRLMQKILDHQLYAPIVEKHFGFHLKAQANRQQGEPV